MIHFAFNALDYGIFPSFARGCRKNSKCIQHDFPRLCGAGRGKATGQCNMSATADFLPLPLIQDEQVVSYRRKKGP